MSRQSITELRGLCQSLGAKWSFADSPEQLKQKISMRQTELIPPTPLPVVPVPEDQRLRTKPPAKISDEDIIRSMLSPFFELGLNIRFENGQFYMWRGEKTDSGTLRQPPRVILDCARRLME